MIKKQRGAALIVSLVILLAMTLIAVTSMKGTSTELAMAGNLRESGLTFQAAEAGLRVAESIVATSTSRAAIVGLVAEGTADPDYLDAGAWATQADANIDLSSVGIYSQPKYIIKFVDENSANPLGLVNIGSGYGGSPKGKIISIYRITARASGQTGTTFRTVQSHYGIEY